MSPQNGFKARPGGLWVPIYRAKGFDAAVAGTAVMSEAGTYSSVAGGNAYLGMFTIDADAPDTMVRLAVGILVNATAPGNSWKFELVPVATTAGATGALSLTVGASVAELPAFSPALGPSGPFYSLPVYAPAAGTYLIERIVAGSAIANSQVACTCAVQTARP